MVKTDAPTRHVDGAELARLLETESRLEDALRRGRDEAAALVASARAAAAARETACDAALEADVAGLRATITGERRRREAEIREQATREARAFDEIGADRIETLARWAVDQVIGGAP